MMSLMKNAREAFGRFVGRPVRELVGTDRLGNKYIRYQDGDKERREVEWHAPYMLYDPNEVPAEWRMWLRKLRNNPPSVEEVLRNEQAAAGLKQRVAVLDAAEHQRTLRMQAMGQQPPSDQGPSMERLMGQVAGQPTPRAAGATRPVRPASSTR